MVLFTHFNVNINLLQRDDPGDPGSAGLSLGKQLFFSPNVRINVLQMKG